MMTVVAGEFLSSEMVGGMEIMYIMSTSIACVIVEQAKIKTVAIKLELLK
ncbi:hypothetical protein QSV34_03215 [Porticoccus sp. W117]|nr:hypothetical protein [Porticoccus sp. W117]MDM3870359.1 hypothetical protein [Porticoccus sp. W117]